MKISPVPSISVPTVSPDGNPTPSRVESIRALKMVTNATPLQNQQFPILDNNSTTAASVEATQPLSPQLALLSKQRRALQVKERELANREKALESQATGSSGIDIARLKSQPLNVLLENGVTYDQLTEAIIAGQGNSEMDALKAKLTALEQGIDQKFTDRETAAEKQVLAEMQREANQLVNNDDYELVRETRSIPKVMQLIEKTYRATGEVIDVPEAMKLVEDELFKDAQKIAGLKKLQNQMAMTQQPLVQNPPAQYQPRQGMRTLTNKDTASVPLGRRARAMAAFYRPLVPNK